MDFKIPMSISMFTNFLLFYFQKILSSHSIAKRSAANSPYHSKDRFGEKNNMYHQALSALLATLLCTAPALAAEDAQPGNLIPRQESAACTKAASSILSALPSGGGRVVSYIESAVGTGTGGAINPTRLCSVVSHLPSSLQSEFSAYDNSLASWFSTESSRIGSLVSSCSGDSAVQSLASMTSNLQAYASGCNGSSSSAGGSSSGSGTGTAAGAGSSSTGGAGTGSSGNAAAAPRETGFLVGAAAMAGVLGVAVFM